MARILDNSRAEEGAMIIGIIPEEIVLVSASNWTILPVLLHHPRVRTPVSFA